MGDRQWDHVPQQWNSGPLLRKCFPKQGLPSGPGKSVMIYALSWLWPSYSLALAANPPLGPQGGSRVGGESSLRAGGGKGQTERLLALGSVICVCAACLVPSFHKAGCTKGFDSYLGLSSLFPHFCTSTVLSLWLGLGYSAAALGRGDL